VIRRTPMQRLGAAIVCGAGAAFALVGVIANLIGGHIGDVLGLLLFIAVMGAAASLQWVRFVSVDDVGLTFRNWFLVHALVWPEISRIDVRRLFQPRTSGWAVVAHKQHGPPVTLRATGRSGSNRTTPAPALLAVQHMAAELEGLRTGGAGPLTTR
jgi:hypothetical protein